MGREELHRLLDAVLDLGQRLIAHPGTPEARRHFQNARREALLGVRAVVDAALEHMDQARKAAAGPAAIKIE